MYRKYLGGEFASYSVQHERVRRVVDRDGDGRADAATVFADGFNDPAAGIGAGVLARKGDVWYTCIPWLWKLRDNDGDGRADRRELLHQGYGVHVGFLGHDLHGLRFGPDGKLYFSIGDRGFNVTTLDNRKPRRARHRLGPALQPRRHRARGLRQRACATRRSWPSTSSATCSPATITPTAATRRGGSTWSRAATAAGGSATSSSPGRSARGPVERGEALVSGVRRPGGVHRPADRQRRRRPLGAGVRPRRQPAARRLSQALLPGQLPRHPAGRAASAASPSEPKGASFELVDSKQFVWHTLATDVDFGPDGALYFSDWVEGWDMPNKGRIYRVLDPKKQADPRVAGGSQAAGRGDGRIAREVDRRAGPAAGTPGHAGAAGVAIRPGGAGRGHDSEARSAVVGGSGTRGPRCHRGADEGRERRPATCLPRAARHLGDGPDRPRSGSTAPRAGPVGRPDPAARRSRGRGPRPGRAGAGRGPKETKALDRLVARLKDDSPRVRSLAAIAVGKLGRPEAVGPLLAMLRVRRRQGPVPPPRRRDGAGRLDLEGHGDPAASGGRCLDVGADGRAAGDATAGRSRDRPVPQGRRPSAGARGRAGDQRRADRRGDRPRWPTCR